MQPTSSRLLCSPYGSQVAGLLRNSVSNTCNKVAFSLVRAIAHAKLPAFIPRDSGLGGQSVGVGLGPGVSARGQTFWSSPNPNPAWLAAGGAGGHLS